MSDEKAQDSTFRIWGVLLLAVTLAGATFLWSGRAGVNLGDEGFLWYGVQQTTSGKVPLRDFQSYDPGRYYFSAAVALVFGKGLPALRFSEAIAQAAGLCMGLLSATRLTRRWTVLGLVGIMLTIWMFPSHKAFDHAVLLASILVAVRLLERPSARRIFVSGCFVGFCTFLGRNHALYNGVAQFGLLVLLMVKMRFEVPPRRILMWAAGLAVGLLPICGMLLFVPGFIASYHDSIQAIFRNGTNLSLEVPWPWRITWRGDAITLLRRLVIATLFLALPISYVCALGLCLIRSAQFLKRYALFAACAALGLLYLHHAFARADASHLAQAIHPFLLGILAAPGFPGRRTPFLVAVVVGLIIGGFLTLTVGSPAYQRWTAQAPWVRNAAIGVDVSPGEERYLSGLRQFAAKNIRPQERLLIAPSAPGLYPILDRKSPLWEVYFLFPEAPERQIEMIRTLTNKGVNWAIVSDVATDHRDELRFSVSHALIWRYLKEKFTPVRQPYLPRAVTIFRRLEVNRGVPAPEPSPPSTR